MSDVVKEKPHLTRSHILGLLKSMLRIRRFEEKCAELYTEEKIRGFLHLYIGEEAIAAGAMTVLQPEDAVVATYREHGHALARGISMDAVMAEMFGKQEGCSRGRGGSMHLFDASKRFYGGNAIVAGGLRQGGSAVAEERFDVFEVPAIGVEGVFGEAALRGQVHEKRAQDRRARERFDRRP